MPFPWKKGGKRQRISQLVAGHLKQPKRGGSLVVETGFPTSLIDLFVKNRDRLKKKKKNRYDTSSDPLPNRPSQPTTPFESLSVTPRTSVSCDESNYPRASPVRESKKSCVVVRGGDEINGGGGGGGGGGEVLDGKRVLAAVLKIFLVVILALGTKRFAVGITMSAFLLIFLEFVGRHGCKLLKPCGNTRKRVNSLIQSVFQVFGIKQGKVVKEEEEIRVSKKPKEQETVVIHELSESMEEIILQANAVLVPPIEEIQCVKGDVEGERKDGSEVLDTKKVIAIKKGEEGNGGDVVVEIKQRTRGSRFKSKMKRLVPKKFRVSRKKGQGLKIEECRCEGEEKGVKNEECGCVAEDVIVLSEVQDLEDYGDEFSMVSSGVCDQEEDDDGKSSCTEVARSEVGREEERNAGPERNVWYLMLFLTVLVGLVGGRVMALVLTVSSCFMVRSARSLLRSKKKPQFRSSATKSTSDLDTPCL